MKAVTIEQSNELQALARKIRAGASDTKAFAQLANRKAQEGVGEALQCGLALIAARRILGRTDLKHAYAAIGVPPSNSHHSANLNQGNES